MRQDLETTRSAWPKRGRIVRLAYHEGIAVLARIVALVIGKVEGLVHENKIAPSCHIRETEPKYVTVGFAVVAVVCLTLIIEVV